MDHITLNNGTYGIHGYTNRSRFSLEVGQVSNGYVTLSPTGAPFVVGLVNNAIIMAIAENQEKSYGDPSFYDEPCIIGPLSDQMKFQFLSVMRYRRCTVYIVVQYSSNTSQTRILAYGCDAIRHSAQCFGTSLESVSREDIVNYIDGELNKNLARFGELSDGLKNRNYLLFL